MAYAHGDWEVAVDMLASGIHPWTWTFALISNGAADPTDANAVAAGVLTSFDGHLKSHLGAYVATQRCRTKALDTGDQGIAAGVHAGTYNTGEACPQNVSVCVSLHTAHAGRSGRGRFYLSGILTGHLDGGDPNKFTSAFTTALAASVQDFFDAIVAGTGSSFAGAVNSRKDSTLYELSAVTVDQLVDTQRRRVRD